MHEATKFQLQFFQTEHLHPKLVFTVKKFEMLAKSLADGPENAETTHAIKLLVQAKDAACRAIVADGGLR